MLERRCLRLAAEINTMKIEHTSTVQFYDTDCGGVVSNIAYLRFVEQARTELFQNLGMGLAEMNETQLFPAIVRTEIDYRSPAKLGDAIIVTASLEKVEKVRATCSFLLETEREPGKTLLLVSAKQIIALVQMPSGRPRRMPAEWADHANLE
jgi:YbgC/YbaW family acyl-CoA thioester hydrolase